MPSSTCSPCCRPSTAATSTSSENRSRQREPQAHHRRALARRHPVQGRPLARRREVRAPVRVAAVAERRPRRVRNELRGELAGDGGEDRAARPADRGGPRSCADAAPHRLALRHPGVPNGGAGCIRATANTNPAAIARLYDTWRGADADAQQKRLDEIRGTFAKYPMIPALKAAIAHWSGVADWATVRPPLVALTKEQAASLVSDLKAKSFDMPGLGR